MRSRALALILAGLLPLTAGAQSAADLEMQSDPPPPRPRPEVLVDEADVTPGMTPLVVPAPPAPQSLPMMTIDPERLFAQSQWGKRVLADYEARGRALAADNERLANQFSDEEGELTKLRDSMSPEEFRARAEEFDKRVVEVRRERDKLLTDLQHEFDQGRNSFLQAVLPVLAKLMQERGAVVVLDQRAIFVSADSIDVTQELIGRVDVEVGAGPASSAGEAGSPGD